MKTSVLAVESLEEVGELDLKMERKRIIQEYSFLCQASEYKQVF